MTRMSITIMWFVIELHSITPTLSKGGMQLSPRAMCSTVVTPLPSSEAGDFNRVKCVVDRDGHALYFSRSLIPSNKYGNKEGGVGPNDADVIVVQVEIYFYIYVCGISAVDSPLISSGLCL